MTGFDPSGADLTAEGGPDFAAVLDSGEALLWQARPSGAFYGKRDRANSGAMAVLAWVFFPGLGAFMLFTLGQRLQGHPGYQLVLWAFVLLMFLVAWYVTSGRPHFQAFQRRRTWYGLTQKRLLTARKRRNGWHISAEAYDRNIPFRWDRRDPGDVIQVITDSNAATRLVGFRKIPGAGQVHGLLTRLQSTKGPSAD